jgi:transcriptional regulator with XRE-family HTH domain
VKPPRPQLRTLGNRIRHYRLAAGLTQEQLCRKLTGEKSLLSPYVADRRMPRVDKLVKLAKRLNVDLKLLVNP